MKASERGNILFLILLAVVLFAALSYAVTRSTQGGGKNASSESAAAGASAIVNYLTLVRNEVERMRLVNGCAFENFEWRNAAYYFNNGTTTLPAPAATVAQDGCAVFQSRGGPIAPQTFDRYLNKTDTPSAGNIKPGHFMFVWMNMAEAGTDANDFAMWTDYIDTAVCLKILQSYVPDRTAIGNDNFNYSTSRSTVMNTANDMLGDGGSYNRYSVMGGLWMEIENGTICRLGQVLLAY